MERPDRPGRQHVQQLHTGGSLSDTKYSSPQVDDLLDKARAATDQAQRKDCYQQAEKLMVDDAPMAGTASRLPICSPGRMSRACRSTRTRSCASMCVAEVSVIVAAGRHEREEWRRFRLMLVLVAGDGR